MHQNVGQVVKDIRPNNVQVYPIDISLNHHQENQVKNQLSKVC